MVFNCIRDVPNNYECNYCDYNTDLKLNLYYHFQYHQYFQNDGCTIQTYHCTRCNYTTFSIFFWLKHKNQCNKVKRRQKGKRKSERLKSFLQKRTTNDKPYIYCDNKAKSKRNRSHHTKPAKYHCEQCEFKSLKQGDLKRHIIRQHTAPEAINWFLCDKCHYRAKIHYDLTKHISLKHNNMKHLNCDFCEYKTNIQLDLKRHIIRRHTAPEAIEWHECPRCNFKAKFKFVLTQHIKTRHSGREIYSCELCPYRSKNKKLFNQHLRMKHSEKGGQIFTCAF